MKLRLIPVLQILAMCLVTLSAFAQSPTSDPRAGIWKLNLAKSKFSPGPPPQSSVWRFETRQDGFTVITLTGTNGRGEPTFTHVVMKYDEKDYPSYGNNSVTALVRSSTKLPTMSHKLVDPYTMVATPKDSNGVAGLPITVTVTKDGKTLTQKVTGKNAQGQTVDNVAVYDRVQ